MVTPVSPTTSGYSSVLDCAGELESVTVKVMVVLLVVNGVPLINPEESSDNPEGRRPPLTTQLYGAVPPEACSATA